MPLSYAETRTHSHEALICGSGLEHDSLSQLAFRCSPYRELQRRNTSRAKPVSDLGLIEAEAGLPQTIAQKREDFRGQAGLNKSIGTI